MLGIRHVAGMVKVSEIKGPDSLKAWLLDRSEDEAKKFAIIIAHRVAMRVLPVYWAWVVTSDSARESDLTALPVLRCNLISEVAREMPTPEIKHSFSTAAVIASDAAAGAIDIDDASSKPDPAAVAAIVADLASFVLTHPIESISNVLYFDTVISTNTVPSARVFEQIPYDCELLENGDMLLGAPLWNGDKNPFQKEWEAVRQSTTKNQGNGLKYDGALNFDGAYNYGEGYGKTKSIDWSFWVNWYQDALDGREPDWDMLYEVALIPDEDWQKGPKRVNFLIGEIQAKYLSAYTPLAERVEFDPPAAKFHAIPQEPKNPDLLAATLSQVEDAKEDALADTGNGLREDSREVRVLNRTIQRYSNDPQRIEMDFTSVAIGLRRQIEETQELPKSEGNLALLEAVEEGARAIRATHPDVAENRMILAGQVLRELPKEDIAALDEAKEVLVAISEGAMAEDFAEDIPQLINDALLPLPNGAPPLPAMDPAVRVFGRVSRMAMMMQKSGEIVETIHNSKGYKALGIVARGVKITTYLSILVSIGLRLFGIL